MLSYHWPVPRAYRRSDHPLTTGQYRALTARLPPVRPPSYRPLFSTGQYRALTADRFFLLLLVGPCSPLVGPFLPLVGLLLPLVGLLLPLVGGALLPLVHLPLVHLRLVHLRLVHLRLAHLRLTHLRLIGQVLTAGNV